MWRVGFIVADFVVASEAVASAAARLNGYREELDGRARVAGSLVFGVCGSSWMGRAADEFALLWHSWNADAQVVHDALGQMSRVLTEAAAEYAQTEAGVTAMSESMSARARARVSRRGAD